MRVIRRFSLICDSNSNKTFCSDAPYFRISGLPYSKGAGPIHISENICRTHWRESFSRFHSLIAVSLRKPVIYGYCNRFCKSGNGGKLCCRVLLTVCVLQFYVAHCRYLHGYGRNRTWSWVRAQCISAWSFQRLLPTVQGRVSKCVCLRVRVCACVCCVRVCVWCLRRLIKSCAISCTTTELLTSA